MRSTCSPQRNSLSPGSVMRTLRKHLADDDFDVLVVDRHALEAIDFLHFIDHEELVERGWPEDVENLMRVGRPSVSCWPLCTTSPG